MRNRQPIAPLLGLAALLLAGPALAESPPLKRPNFVFFLTDDQRADALSLASHALLKTPNIDRIGKEGAWFQNAFVVNALCTPSRACYLTGKYSHVTGVLDNSAHMTLPRSEPIVAEALKASGYEVAFIGKSHMVGNLRDRTWDYYFGFKGQGRYYDPVISENGQPDKVYKGYMDDILADKALEYLNKPHEKPFCLFLWFKAPHRSWQRPPRYAKLYEGMSVPEPPNFKAGYAGKSKAFADADMKIGDFDDVRNLDHLVKDYSAVVTAVDDNVGRVLKTLDGKKIADDTVVIYGSDNGFFLGEWNFFDKRLMHEPSIRVPLLIRYPRKIKPGTKPTKMALNIDLAATILDFAGIPLNALPGQQGKSLVPLAEGKDVPWRDAWLYEYYEYPQPHRVKPHRGIRTDRWKLIHFHTTPEEFELYDLQADPHESHNLYGQPAQAEIAEQLKKRMAELRKELNDKD